MRIVSLVPSLTEAIAAFGRLGALVGRTRYCTEPAGAIDAIETVGGTKNPDVERIVTLAPDLVIVNKEENRLEDVQRLESAGLTMHVTHPRSVADAIQMLETLGAAVGAPDAAATLASDCRRALDEAARMRRSCDPVPTFCPIWRKPWMTFRERTYIGNVLRVTGFDNVFGLYSEQDFFEVEVDDIRARAPSLLLLPDEPYAFTAEHAEELAAAGLDGEVVHVDGKLLAWYGPRLPAALIELAEICVSVAAGRPVP